MITSILLCGFVLLLCVSSSKLLYRFGIPTLLIFLILGMLFGSDGPGGIYFEDYKLAKEVCSIGLVFIMFYGGFCTNWKVAKPVAKQAIALSTVGVIVTAVLTGVFCHLLMGFTWLEGLLIGAVISSTDAASVFAILRSRKLSLKNGLASLLEVESGSNDPFSYMLMIAVLTMMSNNSPGVLVITLIKQLAFGILIGFTVAKLGVEILKKVQFEITGLYSIFVMAIAIFSYGLSETAGGNGYLCVYIVGLMLGNSKIPYKRSLIHFFDGISWLMQILLFFTLGLLSLPTQLSSIAVTSLGVSIILIFIVRPLAVFGILSTFKMSFKEKLFVSWVGLRGAASIVFAIYAVTYDVMLKNDLFHIVFFVALFSVGVQGTLLPALAKRLDLVEANASVLKTFNDYQEEMGTKLLEKKVDANSQWINKSIMDANIPEEILVVMIKRNDTIIIPKGSTVIYENDVLVLTGDDFEEIAV